MLFLNFINTYLKGIEKQMGDHLISLSTQSQDEPVQLQT